DLPPMRAHVQAGRHWPPTHLVLGSVPVRRVREPRHRAPGATGGRNDARTARSQDAGAAARPDPDLLEGGPMTERRAKRYLITDDGVHELNPPPPDAEWWAPEPTLTEDVHGR